MTLLRIALSLLGGLYILLSPVRKFHSTWMSVSDDYARNVSFCFSSGTPIPNPFGCRAVRGVEPESAPSQEVVDSIPAAGISRKVFQPGRQLQRFPPSEPVCFLLAFHQSDVWYTSPSLCFEINKISVIIWLSFESPVGFVFQARVETSRLEQWSGDGLTMRKLASEKWRCRSDTKRYIRLLFCGSSSSSDVG